MKRIVVCFMLVIIGIFVFMAQPKCTPPKYYANCSQILTKDPTSPSGVYKVDPDGADGPQEPFDVYCDMVTDGGGWTLVWSNLRERTGKPVTKITWADAINTPPRVSGTLGTNLEAFDFYVGLKFWESFGTTLRYDWANANGSAIDQRFTAQFSFDENANYKITMSGYAQKIGSTTAGLWSYHNNMQFSTFDADHDTNSVNCSASYSNTPWWYKSCWDGSINGGGENKGNGYYNGAYWAGSAQQWGTDAGVGAGNGWIFIR